MTSEQIRQRIDQITKDMTAEFSNSINTFVLNNSMIKYQKEISQLQAQCQHHFENGVCIYCDKLEDLND